MHHHALRVCWNVRWVWHKFAFFYLVFKSVTLFFFPPFIAILTEGSMIGCASECPINEIKIFLTLKNLEVLMLPHYLQVCIQLPGWKTWECGGGAGGNTVHLWRHHPLAGTLRGGADLGFLELFRPQLWAVDRQVLLHGAFCFFWGLSVEVTFTRDSFHNMRHVY